MKVRKWLTLALVLVSSFAVLVWYFGIGGLVAAIFETLLLLVLTNPEKAMGYLASLFTLGRNIHFWFERNAVEKRLESTITLSSKRVNEEGVKLLPHGIDIKWAEPESRDAFLKENKIVVCLEPSINEARNLARATMLYTSEDLIRESQRFIDAKIMKAACFAVARKMLMMDRRLDAFKCLNDEFLEPELSNHPSIKGHIEVMEKLDDEGNFTRLFLNEFSELGEKLSGYLSEPRAERETVTFMGIMKKLAEKQKGVDINPIHRGQIINVGIMLIARTLATDPNPYINYARKNWGRGLTKIYVLAQGIHVRLAVAAVLGIKTLGIYRVEKEYRFGVPSKKGAVPSYIAILSRVAKPPVPSQASEVSQ